MAHVTRTPDTALPVDSCSLVEQQPSEDELVVRFDPVRLDRIRPVHPVLGWKQRREMENWPGGDSRAVWVGCVRPGGDEGRERRRVEDPVGDGDGDCHPTAREAGDLDREEWILGSFVDLEMLAGEEVVESIDLGFRDDVDQLDVESFCFDNLGSLIAADNQIMV